jgi:hypothetical protein
LRVLVEFLVIDVGKIRTHNLELNGHDAEVKHLHSRPDNEVRFECRDIDVLELGSDGALATAFTDGHECEEAGETWDSVSFSTSVTSPSELHTDRRKDELIKCHALQSRKGVARASNTNGERLVEESEPPQLDWCHNTRVCHKPDHPLKVKRWR